MLQEPQGMKPLRMILKDPFSFRVDEFESTYDPMTTMLTRSYVNNILWNRRKISNLDYRINRRNLKKESS